MAGDPELDAMTAVAAALKNMDEKTAARVLRWARERYAGTAEPEGADSKGGATSSGGDFEDVAAYYTAASPRTDPERALAVACWFQTKQGLKDFDSQRVNTQLKQMGHGVGNITEAFNRLINRKPQWVIQTRKSGTQRQGRKLYRVTAEGMKRVDAMLVGRHEEASE